MLRTYPCFSQSEEWLGLVAWRRSVGDGERKKNAKMVDVNGGENKEWS